MPIAVLNAATSAICRDKITVSSAIEVKKPVDDRQHLYGKCRPGNARELKKAMVPKIADGTAQQAPQCIFRRDRPCVAAAPVNR